MPETHSPLNAEWTYWFDRRVTNKSPSYRSNDKDAYEGNLKIVGEFNDVETFWCYQNNMRKSSDLPDGSNYHLFKQGIKPMWEDPSNDNGGKWTVQLSGKEKSNLNIYWENLTLALIGEYVDDHDDVCGAVMSKRKKSDKISVWNRSFDKKENVMELGYRIKKHITDGVTKNPSFSMTYTPHHVSLSTGSSYQTKAMFSISAGDFGEGDNAPAAEQS